MVHQVVYVVAQKCDTTTLREYIEQQQKQNQLLHNSLRQRDPGHFTRSQVPYQFPVLRPS